MTITDEDISHMRTCASYNKRYHTDVEISTNDLIDGGLEQISHAATGSALMGAIDYQVVDFKARNVLVLHVSGLVNDVIDELNRFQLSGG